MLKAVIFDMDGVIIDSEPLHARANILALKKFGVDVDMNYVSRFIGNTILYMCETIKQEFNLDISAARLSQESARQIAALHELEGYTPVPYVKKLIQDLRSHGLKLAIASSSTMELIQEIVSVFELESYFDELVSGTSVAHSKPAPDIFLKACEQLNVSCDDAIIIEDSMNGVLAAVRAGIPAIGLLNPNSGNQDLSKASILIESFEGIDTAFVERTYQHAHHLPATIAKTPRLLIRELGMEDVPALYQLYQDESFVKNHLTIASSLQEAQEKMEAYIQHMYRFCGFGLWGVFLNDSHTLIGHCGIEPKQLMIAQTSADVMELGYGIASKHQQQGYALEALQAILDYATNVLYLHELYVRIHPKNSASISLAKKLGFVPCSNANTLSQNDSEANLIYHKLGLTNEIQ